jgi:SAM-dependent methyltransferase
MRVAMIFPPMPRRPALLLLAAAALLLSACGSRTGDGNQPSAAFDPARFVASAPALDAPQIASDGEVVDAMLALAQVRPDDMVVDLGSGDGRILIAAARSHGARGLGVDIDPAALRQSTANARAAGVAGRVDFRRQDLFETPLADADVVTLYLTPEVNLRLRPRILAQMRPGTRVVSEDFDMGDWRPERHQRIGETELYMWIVPARLAGRWRLSLGGRTLPLALTQRYQELDGTLGADGRVGQGWVTGHRVHFVADVDGRAHVFEGRFDGQRLVSTRAEAPWQAVRAS